MGLASSPSGAYVGKSSPRAAGDELSTAGSCTNAAEPEDSSGSVAGPKGSTAASAATFEGSNEVSAAVFEGTTKGSGNSLKGGIQLQVAVQIRFGSSRNLLSEL